METHHVIVPLLTGRPIKQGVDVNSVRLPWNSRKTWELAFIENLTLAFTLLYFFFMHNVVYKHNTVSQHCTFMQMTSSIFLLHAAAQFKSKLVQLQVTPRLWTESCRHSALNYKTIWLKPSKQKKCMRLQSSDLAHILGCDSLSHTGRLGRPGNLYETIPARGKALETVICKSNLSEDIIIFSRHIYFNSPIS